MRGAYLAYGAMWCVALAQYMVLCNAPYFPRVACYEVRGTCLAYGAMRRPADSSDAKSAVPTARSRRL
eukprot:3940454-Rhodomonas_salina.3